MKHLNEISTGDLRAIEALPDTWHACGSVSNTVLHAIVRHVRAMGGIEHSLETGSGRTTLLLSHLSPDHLVFALDAGGSISQVRSSELFQSANVRYVEGPTQRTLPAYAFSSKFQFALIDGPHGYPFPDLEYYYIYPLIDEGSLLVIDDIRIPSIRRMFDIINAGSMFTLLEVVSRNTAFFRRTRAPLIDPCSDSWWENGYNKRFHGQVQLRQKLRALLRRIL